MKRKTTHFLELHFQQYTEITLSSLELFPPENGQTQNRGYNKCHIESRIFQFVTQETVSPLGVFIFLIAVSSHPLIPYDDILKWSKTFIKDLFPCQPERSRSPEVSLLLVFSLSLRMLALSVKITKIWGFDRAEFFKRKQLQT